jgi:hypothetical protein
MLATKKFETPWRISCSYKKGSLERDMPSIRMLVGLLLALTWQAASALLKLSSSTSSSWRGLCQQPDWAPHQLGAQALATWACSWSLQGHDTNSATSGTLGSSERIFHWWWLACSNTLACLWWSLEGLLAAAQNWPIFYKKVLDKKSLACRHSCVPWRKLVDILVEPL